MILQSINIPAIGILVILYDTFVFKPDTILTLKFLQAEKQKRLRILNKKVPITTLTL